MILKPIQVKILNETNTKVLVYLPNSNSEMKVDKETFYENVEKGLYIVISSEQEELA
jgi:hypothetical protein